MATIAITGRYGSGIYGISNYGGDIAKTLAGVAATGAIGTLEHSNTKTLVGVVGTTAIEAPSAGGFEIDISERVDTGVAGTGSVNTVQVNLAPVPTGVSATGSIGSLEHSNTILLQGVAGTLAEPLVEPKVTAVIGGVSATGAVNDDFEHSNSTIISSVASTVSAGIITGTGVIFDFESVQNLYSRRRTVLIPRAA